MKKTFIFGLILLAILLTGCLPSGRKESTKEGTKPEGQEQKEESYSGNLEKMMGLGLPLKCSWKQDESYYGESWIKDKNSYGEVHQEGKVAKVIAKDNCIWAWEEGNLQGTKMCFKPGEMEAAQTETETTTQDQPNFQYQQPKVNYQCQPAVFGEDKFNPPAEVNFTDINQMMENPGQ